MLMAISLEFARSLLFLSANTGKSLPTTQREGLGKKVTVVCHSDCVNWGGGFFGVNLTKEFMPVVFYTLISCLGVLLEESLTRKVKRKMIRKYNTRTRRRYNAYTSKQKVACNNTRKEKRSQTNTF
jgi:hypothetical protein